MLVIYEVYKLCEKSHTTTYYLLLALSYTKYYTKYILKNPIKPKYLFSIVINEHVKTLKPELKEIWHHDEMKIQAGGKWKWLWNIMDDVWEIGRVPPIKQMFPTQKPEPLLERIIKSSSNEGDIVLDPFCGCGTTLVASQRLKRRWIGIALWRIRRANVVSEHAASL